MTENQPAPEAVEAVADAISSASGRQEYALWDRPEAFAWHAEAALVAIRFLLHADGTDADAVREALGLELKESVRDMLARETPRRRVVGGWRHR